MLTLVDLLLQLLFLGLLGFAVSAVAMRGGDKKVPVSAETLRRLDSIAIAEGYSNVAQLTDALTRLAPIRDMGKLSAMAKQTGGADSVVRIVEQALRGIGLPPCKVAKRAGRVEAVPIATITAWDDSIRVVSIGDSLTRIMQGRSGATVPSRTVSLRDFRPTFRALVRDECRYRAVYREMTDRVFARDTISKVFSLAR